MILAVMIDSELLDWHISSEVMNMYTRRVRRERMSISDYENMIISKVQQKPMGMSELASEIGDFKSNGDLINSLYALLDQQKIRRIRHDGRVCYVAY